jgi:hypothetical protein
MSRAHELTAPLVSFADIFYDRNDAKDDCRKQDRDDNRRATFGRPNSQRHKYKEQRCGTSDQRPLSQHSPERVATLLIRERPGFWPPPRGHTRQPVGDTCWNGQGSDCRTTKLKFGYPPKQNTFPDDADRFLRDKKVAAKRSEDARHSDPKPRIANP